MWKISRPTKKYFNKMMRAIQRNEYCNINSKKLNNPKQIRDNAVGIHRFNRR